MSEDGIALDSSDLGDDDQIVGRKIYRIIPYIFAYWQRALGGLLANIGARAFDLIPFIAIGMAADYYNPNNSQFTDSTVERIVSSDILPSIGPIGSIELLYK